MITRDKVTEIFCIIDEFDKNLSDVTNCRKTCACRQLTGTA